MLASSLGCLVRCSTNPGGSLSSSAGTGRDLMVVIEGKGIRYGWCLRGLRGRWTWRSQIMITVAKTTRGSLGDGYHFKESDYGEKDGGNAGERQRAGTGMGIVSGVLEFTNRARRLWRSRWWRCGMLLRVIRAITTTFGHGDGQGDT